MKWLKTPLFDTLPLEKALKRWEGTPYRHGARVRGVGVDCLNLVAGVLDLLYARKAPTPVPVFPMDTGIHEARPGMSQIRAIRASFASFQVRDSTIEPGDILVVRTLRHSTGFQRPGHALIAGLRPYTLFHAVQGEGACWTSLEVQGEILRIYRLLNKETWSK